MPPVTYITNLGDALLVSATTALGNFLSFLPGLLGALLLLVLGWVIANALRALIEKGLQALGFERAVHRSGIGDFLARTGTSWTTTKVVAELVKWFVFLIFVQAAANVLGMPQVTSVINSIALFIPNVVVAVAILVIGSLLANVVSGLVRGSATEMGLGNPGMLAAVTRYAIIGFAVVAAVDQLGIAETVVNTLLIGLVGSVALAIGLAFGLGGRDVAAEVTRQWYEDSKTAARKIQAATPNEGDRLASQPYNASETEPRTPATRPATGGTGGATRPGI